MAGGHDGGAGDSPGVPSSTMTAALQRGVGSRSRRRLVERRERAQRVGGDRGRGVERVPRERRERRGLGAAPDDVAEHDHPAARISSAS